MKRKKAVFLERKTRLHKLLCMLTVAGFCLIAVSFCLSSDVGNAQSLNEAQVDLGYQLAQRLVPDVEFENNKVYIGLWVINTYDFDYRSQYYTLDMYIYFYWIDPDIEKADWYLMNGYPVHPVYLVPVRSSMTDGVKYAIYRVPARLFSSPERAADYPLDLIELRISIELLISDYDVSLVWLRNDTGLDPNFENPGWKTVDVELSDSENVYPLGTTLPEVEMVITQQRNILLGQLIFSISPPLLFGVLGGVTFLFIPKTIPLIGTRIGLISSILIADLLYNLSALSSIPPLENVAFYGVLLICILIFLFMNLIVTIVGLAVLLRYDDARYARRINKWGFLISLVIPLALLIVTLVFS